VVDPQWQQDQGAQGEPSWPPFPSEPGTVAAGEPGSSLEEGQQPLEEEAAADASAAGAPADARFPDFPTFPTSPPDPPIELAGGEVFELAPGGEAAPAEGGSSWLESPAERNLLFQAGVAAIISTGASSSSVVRTVGVTSVAAPGAPITLQPPKAAVRPPPLAAKRPPPSSTRRPPPTFKAAATKPSPPAKAPLAAAKPPPQAAKPPPQAAKQPSPKLNRRPPPKPKPAATPTIQFLLSRYARPPGTPPAAATIPASLKLAPSTAAPSAPATFDSTFKEAAAQFDMSCPASNWMCGKCKHFANNRTLGVSPTTFLPSCGYCSNSVSDPSNCWQCLTTGGKLSGPQMQRCFSCVAAGADPWRCANYCAVFSQNDLDAQQCQACLSSSQKVDPWGCYNCMLVTKNSAGARAACLNCIKTGYRAYECGMCASKPGDDRQSKCFSCMTTAEGLRNPGGCIYST
jgi:hypothetical protein